MKRYKWDSHNRACDIGGALDWNEMFPLGSDGKRHPTKREILETVEWLVRTDNEACSEIRRFLKSILDVAPEDDAFIPRAQKGREAPERYCSQCGYDLQIDPRHAPECPSFKPGPLFGVSFKDSMPNGYKNIIGGPYHTLKMAVDHADNIENAVVVELHRDGPNIPVNLTSRLKGPN